MASFSRHIIDMANVERTRFSPPHSKEFRPQTLQNSPLELSSMVRFDSLKAERTDFHLEWAEAWPQVQRPIEI
jgi:hypothetical protein